MIDLALLNEIEEDVLRALNEINGLSSKEDKQIFFRKQRDIVIKGRFQWIDNYIDLIAKNSIEGENINISKLDPYLEIVREKDQVRNFKIFRFLSTYPFSEPMGRRIKFIIRDRFHKSNPIMGIGCISSPVINLRVRDKYIGWTSNDSNKFKRLKNIVELSCAIGIPPFNELCVGKLIALLALSSELIHHYGEKYDEPNSYVLISGTGLYGKNCTLFNRLRLDGERIYNYIGDTKGFTHVHINPVLYSKIEKVAERSQLKFLKGGSFITNRKMKNIENVFYQMRTPYRKLLILPLRKAIFVAPTASNYRSFLLGKEEKPIYREHKAEYICDYWKNRWMRMRIKNENVISRIKDFTIEMHKRALFKGA